LTLSILTAVCGAIEITERWFVETVGSCTTSPEVVVVSNGNTETEADHLASLLPVGGKLIIESSPLGSTRAFNRGLTSCTGDVVAMLHNDLMLKQQGWDEAVLEVFASTPGMGVAGLHGSQALGHPALYQLPYELHQLARGRNWSNLEDAEAHGNRTNLITEVVTLDGMALIARRDDLESWGGLDEKYTHHMYDHDLCLTARKHGRRNYLIPLPARHVSGQTANAQRYQDQFGPDAEIHRQAHATFYESWRGTGMLPAEV
jgi:GT2 family glycosyltransferase